MNTEGGEQTGAEKAPLTREDVLRLISEHGGTAAGLDLSERDLQRIDLSGLNLEGINLQGARLLDANLQGAHLLAANLQGAGLWGANLQGAGLGGANLQGALLGDANLQGAYLWDANLQGARLGDANLQGAYLWGAKLQGARLGGAKLQGARLWGANLQGAYLHGARLYSDTELQNADWGDYRLGEERDKEWGDAVDAYRALKAWHRAAGLDDQAAAFSFRERECARKGATWTSRLWKVPAPNVEKLWLHLYGALAGHGERPQNVVLFGLAVLLGMAAIYLLRGTFDKEIGVWDAVYYSVVSFTSLGYGGWAPEPEGWARYVGAAESLVGGFTIALFLVTFARKMMR